MNVVHLASVGELGGAELVILDILAGLRRSRPTWSLELIVPAPGPLQARASQLGVRVRIVEWRSELGRLGDTLAGRKDLFRIGLRMLFAAPALLMYAVKLRAALRQSEATIIHAHGSKMLILGMWTRPRGVPLVLHLHDYITRRPIVSRLLRARARGPLFGAAISKSIAEDARQVVGASVPVEIIYNGIDTTVWRGDGESLDLDAASGLAPAPRGTIRVGLVATMARWKGHEVFLDALGQLKTAVPVRGYVIGGSIYRTDRSQHDIDQLRRVAAEMGVADRVGFTGFVDDPAAAMRALDVVVHASTQPEPFGRVILEGMSTERAVISTATGGAAELIEPDLSAVAVPPGDAAALARAIDRLADDPTLRRRLGVAGRARAVRCFDRGMMTDAVVRVYESIFSAQHARR